MRKLLLTLGVTMFLALPLMVKAESIQDFSVKVRVNVDATLDVEETIVYDFGTDQKHGIYRDIPYKYRLSTGNFSLRLSDYGVADENGTAIPYSVSNAGGTKKIKIGDPNQTVTGENTYVIKYRVKKAINYFTDHDEVYWNATGHGWTTPIEQAKLTIIFPQALPDSDINTDCFAGAYGAKDKCLSTRRNYESKDMVNEIVFTHDRLDPGEELTGAVGLPKGIIEEPGILDRIGEAVKDNGILFLPLLVLIFFGRLWWTRGRDPRGRVTIVPEYAPPAGLTPAEVGVIIDEWAGKKDVAASIISLALQGLLKIERIEGKGVLGKDDYELEKISDSANIKSEHEKKLFLAIFKDNKTKVKLSDLKEKFYKDLEEIKKSVYEETVAKGYFPKSPKTVRIVYLATGIGICVSGWFIGMAMGAWAALAVAFSGLIIIIFSFFMPRRTRTGVLAREQILGLRMYLTVAEKDRLKFHNAPEKNPQHFEKLLPYAMVLGVEQSWAKQFEGIYKEPPGWYSDSGSRAFSALALTNSLSHFQSQAGASLSSAPSGGSGIGGGGFSGGGFGGGGGGSW